MSKVVVVFHSGYGHTAKLAEAVAKGASSVEGSEVKLIPVAEAEAHWDDFQNADAIIMGAPTYMGSLSAEFKKFMEQSSKFWMTQSWKDKIAGGFTNSASLSGDKLSSILQLVVFAGQHSMIWVSVGVPAPTSDYGNTDNHNRMGSFLGVMSQSPHNSSPETAPPNGDLKTGESYGKRIAEYANRLKA